MNFGIFGSCVSRDTCEYMSDAAVVTYVARQSVTSLVAPHGEDDFDFDELTSPFQLRMITGDLQGNGVDRLTKVADRLDLLLIDLIDERRGFWQFPDGSRMTNSIEVELCGAGLTARKKGARLVEFGDEEHFAAWKTGFSVLIDRLKESEIWDRTVLLDIEWAGAVAGSPHPESTAVGKFGRRWRKLQRGGRDASRRLSRGAGLGEAWRHFRNVRPTEIEEFADRAARANADYERYLEFARPRVASVVVRRSREMRIGPDHRWGPQPFHYREEDYLSIVDEIRARADELGPARDGEDGESRGPDGRSGRESEQADGSGAAEAQETPKE